MSDLPTIQFNPRGAVPGVIEEVRAYWAGKCAGGRLPAREQIRPSEIKPWLPHILLADAIDGGADFRYRLVGTRIAQDFRAPPTGRLMSAVIAPYGSASVDETLRAYRRVVETGAPLQIRGSGAWYAQGAKTFDAILMPLSDDGETVNIIFGAFVFEWHRNRRIQTSPLAEAMKG